MQNSLRRALTFSGVLAVGMGTFLAACNSDKLLIPNENSATPPTITGDLTTGLQLLATGILLRDRAGLGGFISDLGLLGRESFNYFPTDGRTTQHYLNQNPLDPSGFAQGGFANRYASLRNIFNFKNVIAGAGAGLSAAQKEAALGYAETFEGLELLFEVLQYHDQGGVTEILADPTKKAPFVSRDSVYNFIVAKLESGNTHLAAGGTDFPFTLGGLANGANDFSTVATFKQFNRAITARTQVYRASLRNPACGATGTTCYTAAATILNTMGLTFISAAKPMSYGVYHKYSTDPGDALTPLAPGNNPFFFAHPGLVTGAQSGDLRLSKFRTLPAARGASCSPGCSIFTNYGFSLYPGLTDPLPVITNAELFLLRAEAEYFTGATALALADLNFVRTTDGGLAPYLSFTSDSDFIHKLLYERTYSLLAQGHRLVDYRRFGLILELPLDIPATQFRQKQQPIPQGECQTRIGTATPCPVNS